MSNTVLAVESGVAGGSLAVFRGRQLASSWSDPKSTGKSEALLSQIEAMLERAGVTRSALTSIAVSIGPGSYTGLRIGIATALGLSKALGVPCRGIPLLKAIAHGVDDAWPIVAAVPIGRKGVGWQKFDPRIGGSDKWRIEAGEIADLQGLLGKLDSGTVLLHSDLFEKFTASGSDLPASAELRDIGRDLAVAIGSAPATFDQGLVPLYAREMTFPTLTGEKRVIR